MSSSPPGLDPSNLLYWVVWNPEWFLTNYTKSNFLRSDIQNSLHDLTPTYHSSLFHHCSTAQINWSWTKNTSLISLEHAAHCTFLPSHHIFAQMFPPSRMPSHVMLGSHPFFKVWAHPYLLLDAFPDPHSWNTTLNYIAFHSWEIDDTFYPYSSSLYAAFTN